MLKECLECKSWKKKNFVFVTRKTSTSSKGRTHQCWSNLDQRNFKAKYLRNSEKNWTKK